MDVTFTDDQELLRKSAREFLEAECPTSVAREVISSGPGVPRAAALQKHIGELGWMGVAFDEADGGLGQKLLDAAILAEEMGRALLPVPWFSSAVLGGEAIRIAGDAEQRRKWLSRVASGEIGATLAVLESDGLMGPGGIASRAKKTGKHYALSGVKSYVPDLSGAEVVVVAALAGREPALFVVDAGAVVATEEPNLDLTRGLYTIRLDGVRVSEDRMLGGVVCGWDAIERILDRAAAVLSAEMCGGAQRMLDLSVEYAKNRHQFGRPIGSFQGVSHRCAEMLLAIESARSLAYYAAWCCDEDRTAAPLAVSSAKAAASDAYRFATAQAIQIHGGIGFTWEADLHLWYRRALGSAAMLGDAVYHRERVASLIGL